MAIVNNGLINNFTIRPRNLTQYTAFRGVSDFTQIGQFGQYETGYSFLSVLGMPKFLTELAKRSSAVESLITSFKHMLEYEFRGFSGLPDIQGETFQITDGINNLNVINKVTSETAVTLSTPYFEKTGSLITKFSEYYLTGLKDRITQAKHYHGLIKNGILEPGYENEVFTFMYYVTDNTMLRLEKAYLLTNCQLTKAETSMYDTTKGEISNKEMTIEFNCFPVWGYEVDKAAYMLLQDINGVAVDTIDSVGNVNYHVVSTENVAALDSNDYMYGILKEGEPEASDDLVDAIKRANKKDSHSINNYVPSKNERG